MSSYNNDTTAAPPKYPPDTGTALPPKEAPLVECAKCKSMVSQTTTIKMYDHNGNLINEICARCYTNLSSEYEMADVKAYKKTRQKLKSSFDMFMTISEKGLYTNRGKLHLKLRKLTIKLRDELKEFRKVSLNYEKFLDKSAKDTEETIKDKFEKA